MIIVLEWLVLVLMAVFLFMGGRIIVCMLMLGLVSFGMRMNGLIHGIVCKALRSRFAPVRKRAIKRYYDFLPTFLTEIL